MNRSSFRVFKVAAILLMSVGFADSSAAQNNLPGLEPYLRGLEALEAGQLPQAVDAFSRALETNGDDPTFVLARGVSRVLAEQFPQGLKDLERAQRLGLRGREAQLWIYTAEAMSGIIVNKDHALGGAPNRGDRPNVVSIPGHVAQGGQDYSSAYGSFVVYQVGMAYQKYRLPVDLGGVGNPIGVKDAVMQQNLRKAAQLFAERWLQRPELAAANLARAKRGVAANDSQGALRSIERGLSATPADSALRMQAGESWLALGRPVSARREFTIALTARTDLVAGYLGRAGAAARMGDTNRALADLNVAAHLDAAETSKKRPAIEADLARYKSTATPEQLMAELDQAIANNASMDALINIAGKLHVASAALRLRYDEIHQDRLRVLENETRAAPKNPDKWVQLAAYILSEADNRGEKVEPRREMQWFRFQESAEKENLRALQLLDQALTLNPRHVSGLAHKALALTALKRYDAAEKFAEQALAIGGDNPDALRLYARFRAMRANQMSSEAAGLRSERCSSSNRTENRSDGVYEVTTTTCYPPSQADLSRARELEVRALQLRKQARSAMEAAVRVTRGTAEGALIEADLHLWDGKVDAAQSALERAVKIAPRSLEAQDRLVQFYAQTGRAELAEEQQVIARRLIHTTSAPLLRLAWSRIQKTAWQAARGYLARARTLDPEDARALAYLGVVHEGEEQHGAAIGLYRAVIAMEEARLTLDEPVARNGVPLTRDAMDFGLAMQAAFHLALLYEKSHRERDALEIYRRVLAYVPRMKPIYESRQMFSALWPDQKPEKGAVVIKPDNAATLVALAHLRAGKLYSAAGDNQEAIRHFRSAAQLGPLRMAGTPQIGNASGDTNFSGIAGAPAAEAQFYLAKELVAQGDIRGASQVLYEAGRNLPEHLRPELNELNLAMARMKNSQPRDDFEGMPPDRRAAAEAQRQRDLARNREGARVMASRARVVPELVGTWDLVPNNKYLPRQQVLRIDADASFALTSKQGTRQGKVDIQVARMTRRTSEDPARGQMMLLEPSGEIGTLWYEFVDQDRMHVTDLEGTEYEAKRR